MEQKEYNHICVGGTFDEIHSGHRALLIKCIECSRSTITVGVTDESMLGNKTLAELIKPLDERMEKVTNLLQQEADKRKKQLKFNVVSISDPFGPAITDATIDGIVVSTETKKGAVKINDIRSEKGMTPLGVIEIDLIPGKKESEHEEDKESSSSLRMRRLGTLLREPSPKPHLPLTPYLIGLTGGIATGKSTIAGMMKELGAGVIDCDKEAHRAYANGTDAYSQIVSIFGPEVVNQESQQIDRRQLGQCVFNDLKRKKQLEDIVWPATQQLVTQMVTEMSTTKPVIVIEAAQMLEANWTNGFHQIWVAFLPPAVSTQRLIQRNNLDPVEAKRIVDVQMDNRTRLGFANVAFCSLWDRTFTKSQVVKAWNMLSKYVPK